MGVMTLPDMRTELQELHLKNRSDVTGVTDTRLDRWINWAYDHVSHPSVFQHPQLRDTYEFSLATGTNEYGISPAATSFQITVTISVTYYYDTTISPNTRRRKLRPRDIRWFDDRTINTGPPSIYAIDDDETLFISPVPTSVENGNQVRIRLYKEPTYMTGTAATVLTRYWDEVILQGAKWRALRDMEYLGEAEVAKQEYAAMINEVAERRRMDAEDYGWRVDVVSQSVMGD